MGCGRLNIITEHVQPIFEVVAPVVRARQDIGHLTALAQLSAKFGLASHAEADKVLQAVCVCFQMPESQRKRGYTSQVVYGQLLLALVFSEEASATRDRALVMAVSAVQAAFGHTLAAMDERLIRQLQVVQLACHLERPEALSELDGRGLIPFLEDVQRLDHETAALAPVSSRQHLQVSGALKQLGVK